MDRCIRFYNVGYVTHWRLRPTCHAPIQIWGPKIWKALNALHNQCDESHNPILGHPTTKKYQGSGHCYIQEIGVKYLPVVFAAWFGVL